MKKLILLLPALMAAIAVLAGAWRVEDIPMAHLQDGRRYVSNPDGILSPAAVAGMDSALHRLEQQTGIQVLAVAVEHIEGGDCFEFAYQLGERNGVGEKRARQRVGHPSRHWRTLRAVRHRLRAGSFAAGCPLQADTRTAHAARLCPQ